MDFPDSGRMPISVIFTAGSQADDKKDSAAGRQKFQDGFICPIHDRLPIFLQTVSIALERIWINRMPDGGKLPQGGRRFFSLAQNLGGIRRRRRDDGKSRDEESIFREYCLPLSGSTGIDNNFSRGMNRPGAEFVSCIGGVQ